MTETDVLIIGAGLSGLLLANKINRPSIILEKSRGLGGRIATRRINDQGLDHGALYFPNDSLIMNLFNDFGLSQSVKSSDKGLYIEKGMVALPKAMAKDLVIHKSEKAEKIEYRQNKWFVQTDHQNNYCADDLIITAPLPQALELLEKNSISFPVELHDISYSKALIAFFICDSLKTPENLSPSLNSIERMDLRGLHTEGYVVRANEEMSEQLFEKPDEEILSFLERKFSESFSTPPFISARELKKWKYVFPRKALSSPFMRVQKHLYLIGDAFSMNDIRGSIKSAEELSRIL